MKTAVEAIFVGKDRLYNRRFLQMCSHYLVDPVASRRRPAGEGAGRDQVGLVRERFFTPRLRFKTYDEMNAWLMDQCVAYAKAHRHPELSEQTIWEAFEAERPKLVPYTDRFDRFHAVPASISKTCLVRFDNNKYSVAASAVGRPVEIQAYPTASCSPGTDGTSPSIRARSPVQRRSPWTPKGKEAKIQGVSVRPTRKPKPTSRTSVESMTRSAERSNPGSSYQAPPRTTRLLQSPVNQAEPSVGAPS